MDILITLFAEHLTVKNFSLADYPAFSPRFSSLLFIPLYHSLDTGEFSFTATDGGFRLPRPVESNPISVGETLRPMWVETIMSCFRPHADSGLTGPKVPSDA